MTTISHEKALEKLIGGLWHTTHPDRFERIIESGSIIPEPDDIPDEKRWSTSQGPDLYTYVRKFVPFRKIWGCAVWVELDRTKTAKSLIQGSDLLKLQEQNYALY